MIKRCISTILALLLLGVSTAYAQNQPQESAPQESASQALPAYTLAELLTSCVDTTLSGRTALIETLHTYVLGEMQLALQVQLLTGVQSKKEIIDADALVGLADAVAQEAIQKELNKAQMELDKAELEQRKVITQIRALTGLDIRAKTLSAQDVFLTIAQDQILLDDLVPPAPTPDPQAIGAPTTTDPTAQSLEVQQHYIDVLLLFAEIDGATQIYKDAVAARETLALDLVTGKASPDDFRVATIAMKQSRISLFSSISAYSRSLYTLNALTHGALCRKVGKHVEYLDGEE